MDLIFKIIKRFCYLILYMILTIFTIVLNPIAAVANLVGGIITISGIGVLGFEIYNKTIHSPWDIFIPIIIIVAGFLLSYILVFFIAIIQIVKDKLLFD